MANEASNNRSSSIQISDLERFLVVWLDERKVNDENESLRGHFREYLPFFVCFDDVRSCEQWFKDRSNDENIFLIFSGRPGKRTVSNLHQLKSIIAIYIFSSESDDHLDWTNHFPKIRAVTSNETELVQRILEDRSYLEEIEDWKNIEIFQSRSHTRIVDPQYLSVISYQLFLQILLSPSYLPRSPSPEQLIDLLRRSISNDQQSEDFIKQFESYSKENPMKWLINNTPISQFVHKVFRERNISLLFYIRFFLVDIHNYFLSNQITSSIHLHGKQMMSEQTLEKIHSNGNDYLMFNSFLLMTTKPSDTSPINPKDNEQYQTVFIEIDADYHDGSTLFVYVEQTNGDPSVLFMCGSIFKIIALEGNNHSNWKLKLSLVGKNDFNLFNEKISKLKGTEDLLIIAELFNQSNQLEKGQIFIETLLREIPRDHPLIPHINNQMDIHSKMKFIPLTRSQFCLIGLKDELSSLASAMFDALQSLTNNSILVLNNPSELNWDCFSNRTMKIFSNWKISSSMRKSIPLPTMFFVLGENHSSNEELKYFLKSEDLIFELADQLCQSYIWEMEHHPISPAKLSSVQKNNLTKGIHHKLKEVYRKYYPTSICTNTTIIWLKYDQQNNEIIEKSRSLLENIVQSFVIFDRAEDSHAYACEEGFNHSLFMIVDDNYNENLIGGLSNLPNLKRIYRYNQPTLRYRLTCDLISHYNQLGARFKQKNIDDQAKEMFSKAKLLCEILPKL